MTGILKRLISFSAVSITLATNINLSTFEDNGLFYQDLKGTLQYSNDADTLALGARYRKTPLRENLDLNLNYDADYTENIGLFGFMSLNSQTLMVGKTRVGSGIAFTPFTDTNTYPYRQKFSLAVVSEYPDRRVLSFRYKFEGIWKKVGLNLVFFHLGYGSELEVKVSYRIDDTFSLTYNLYQENVNSPEGSLVKNFGIEAKF